MPFTLDDSPDKTGLAVVGVARAARLPPARPLLNLTFRQLAARTICKAKSGEYTINLIVARRSIAMRSPSGRMDAGTGGKHGELRDNAL